MALAGAGALHFERWFGECDEHMAGSGSFAGCGTQNKGTTRFELQSENRIRLCNELMIQVELLFVGTKAFLLTTADFRMLKSLFTAIRRDHTCYLLK